AECEAEAHLRPGREALGERERQRLDAEGTLEPARQVAVRHEPDLAQLREPQPHRVARVAPHDGLPASSRTGTSPPRARSCPVPWLPPAGAVADATTCSRA